MHEHVKEKWSFIPFIILLHFSYDSLNISLYELKQRLVYLLILFVTLSVRWDVVIVYRVIDFQDE